MAGGGWRVAGGGWRVARGAWRVARGIALSWPSARLVVLSAVSATARANRLGPPTRTPARSPSHSPAATGRAACSTRCSCPTTAASAAPASAPARRPATRGYSIARVRSGCPRPSTSAKGPPPAAPSLAARSRRMTSSSTRPTPGSSRHAGRAPAGVLRSAPPMASPASAVCNSRSEAVGMGAGRSTGLGPDTAYGAARSAFAFETAGNVSHWRAVRAVGGRVPRQH